MAANVAADALAILGREFDLDIRLDGSVLEVGGSRIPLPEEPEDWDPLDLRHAFPSRAHGDAREKLLYTIVQDASSSGPPSKLDVELRAGLAEAVPLPEPDRQIIAAAMRDAYWVTPKDRPYLIPYHSLLPTSFQHAAPKPRSPGQFIGARYKLFRGVILLFLSWTDGDFDSALIDELLAVMNGTDGFTVIDELMLEAARAAGAAGDGASASALVARFDDLRATLADGVFCQPSLDRFQRDLRTVLTMQQLPRRDLLDVLTALLSLHLAIYYYRVATVLGEGIDRAIAATGQLGEVGGGCDCSGGLARCSLAGRVLFRVGTSGDRPVSMKDGCAVSYRDIDGNRLLSLSATIMTANFAQRIWAALGGPAGRPRPSELASSARADAELARRFDAATSAFTILFAIEKELATTAGEAAAYGRRSPGLFALREAVLESRRSRLKHLSRDVVNQLAKRESGGSLIRTRGRVIFFELDEDFLFLLVKLVCGDGELAFDSFVRGLREYGLAPQSGDEETRLAAALEHLGMLRRYSDAGESIYVHHNV